jgi:hypothetical protein
MKFKLPRKKKKQYKKDNSVFFDIQRDKNNWEWFYFRKRVEVRNMEVILLYPEKATDEQLLDWYKTHYPNDKLSHMYCIQNRHKWDNFNDSKSEYNKYKNKKKSIKVLKQLIIKMNKLQVK